MKDPRFETTTQKFREVSIDTTIEDSEAYQHPVNITYARWEGTNIITDAKVVFIEERKFEGWKFFVEIIEEMIRGFEGTNLEFITPIAIE